MTRRTEHLQELLVGPEDPISFWQAKPRPVGQREETEVVRRQSLPKIVRHLSFLKAAAQNCLASEQRDVFRNVGSTSGDKALGFHFNNGNWSFRCETQHLAVDLAIHIRVSSNQNRLVPKLIDNILG